MPLSRFFNRPIQDTAASEKAGRPVFKDVPYLEIVTPGAIDDIWQRKATDDDKLNYSDAWGKFSASQADSVIGWRIEQWAALSPAEVENLKAMKFLTVESLAEAADQHIKFMGGQALRERARTAIRVAADSSVADKMAKDIADQAAEIERLQGEVTRLGELATKRTRKAETADA